MELISESGSKRDKSGYLRKRGIFLCQVCGSEVEKQLWNGLRDKTCGCIDLNYKHGLKGSRIYKVWDCMRQRCNNPNSINYDTYGGRGVSVCDSWDKSAKAFFDWALENGYKDDLQIDRIDNDGNYEPSNCHFISPAQNARKRTTTKLDWPKVHIIRGLYSSGKITQKRIAEIFGVKRGAVSKVVNYERWK